MEPTRSPQVTLNDLIDRILDKGILLSTDLIITVAGIPLLGVNLRLALAGMETMLEYGIMKDWDEAQRAVSAKDARVKDPPLSKGEYIVFSAFGTHWYSKGIYESWRAGTICVTNQRLFMYRKMPFEILFQISYEDMQTMIIREKPHYTKVTRQELNILLKENEVLRLHAKDTIAVKEAIENILKMKGIIFNDNVAFPNEKEVHGDFLLPQEEVICEENIWYLMPCRMGEGVKYQWKPGRLYLTDKRLCFWYDFDKEIVLDIPIDNLMHAIMEERGRGSTLVGEKSLIVMYRDAGGNNAACFSGNEAVLGEWEKVIKERTKERDVERRTETCPRCGKVAERDRLLEKGCPRCGWVSHRVEN